MTTFSALLATAPVGAEVSLEVPADWAQGRSVFGGLQAALAVRAMRAHVPEAPLRTLQVTFIAPVAGTLHARATVLRTGSSATHVEARVHAADGTLATLAVGVFGTPRTSAIGFVPQQPAVEPTNVVEMAYLEGVVPAFIQHFTARWLRGGLPFSGGTETRHVIEVGMRDDGPASEAHAIALADFVPPLGLSMLRKIAAGSTVTWMLEFLVDRFAFPLAGWRVDADILAARDGYTNQSVTLWGPDGAPVALSRQSMMVFG